MDDGERKEFIRNEIGTIYEEFDYAVSQLLLLRYFLKDVVSVSKGSNPNQETFSKIIKRIK